MYIVYFQSADDKMHSATLATLVTAQDVWDTLNAAGFKMLNTRP